MIDLWFPTAIYRCNLSEVFFDNEYLKSKALSLIYENTTIYPNWRCDTKSTIDFYNWRDDNDSKVKNLIDVIKAKVLDFAAGFGIKKTSNELECKHFWFNIAETGCYQEYHQHCNSHFSCVYYVDVDKDSGNLIFKSIDSITDMHALPVDNDNLTDLSYKTCSYMPKNSNLFIFRSNILHMVEKNLSDKNRISISMNFGFI